MKNLYYYNTKIGKLGICEENGDITNIYFENSKIKNEDYEIMENEIIKEANRQLSEYFDGKRKEFKLPLNPKGTDFKQSVWASLQRIPYGKTCTYKDVAIDIDNPKACRAVGLANNTNPIPIIFPCHRVIGSNKKLVGYAGGLEIKQYLINLEKENSANE